MAAKQTETKSLGAVLVVGGCGFLGVVFIRIQEWAHTDLNHQVTISSEPCSKIQHAVQYIL